MKPLKHLSKATSKPFAILGLGIAFSLLLLVYRMAISASFFYAFLIWNLGLACIPYELTTMLKTKQKHPPFIFAILFCIWLVFLPNAPYIVTDFVHLKWSSSQLIWLDILITGSFASNGLLLFFYTLEDMCLLLTQYIKQLYIHYSIPIVLFLSAFGVYLGRFLRYNSWEIIQNPSSLFQDISTIVCQPQEHSTPWLFTIGFGAFLCLGFWTFRGLKQK